MDLAKVLVDNFYGEKLRVGQIQFIYRDDDGSESGYTVTDITEDSVSYRRNGTSGNGTIRTNYLCNKVGWVRVRRSVFGTPSLTFLAYYEDPPY